MNTEVSCHALPQDLPNPRMEPASLASPASVGVFFTPNATGEVRVLKKKKKSPLSVGELLSIRWLMDTWRDTEHPPSVEMMVQHASPVKRMLPSEACVSPKASIIKSPFMTAGIHLMAFHALV